MGLDIVEFVLAAEKAFDVALPDEELSLITTVGELTDLIEQKLLAKQGMGTRLINEDIYLKIKTLLVEKQGLSEKDIVHSSRFVQDLHMN